MLGGEVTGLWEHGKPTDVQQRPLKERLARGDYDQHINVQEVGLYGLSAMLPGHPLNFILPSMIGGAITAAAAGLVYWSTQVTIELGSRDVAFAGPAVILLAQLACFGGSWWVPPAPCTRPPAAAVCSLLPRIPRFHGVARLSLIYRNGRLVFPSPIMQSHTPVHAPHCHAPPARCTSVRLCDLQCSPGVQWAPLLPTRSVSPSRSELHCRLTSVYLQGSVGVTVGDLSCVGC